MLDLFFWSLFLGVPLFAVLLLRVIGESVNQVALVNITSLALFFFSILGTLPLFYFLDDYRFKTGVQDQYLVLTVLFFSCVNLIFFLFGVFFVRKVIGLSPESYLSKDFRPITSLQNLAIWAVFFICVIVLFDYLRQLDRVAIWVALTDGVDAAKEARSDMGNNFSGKYHWYKLFMRDLGSFITFVTFALWLRSKRLLPLLGFLVVFTYSAFVAIMTTQKAPLAWLLIGLFMVYFLVKSNGIIPFKKLVPFGAAVLTLLAVSYIYFMGSDDIASAFFSVLSRAFSGSISPAYFYLEFFPENQDYLWGRTFPNPGGLMPYEPYRYTVEIMNWRFPELEEKGIVGSAPTVFWGEAYANFGPLGIPIVAFLIGCLVAALSFIISKIEINAISVGFSVWLILFFRDIATTGFSGYLYNAYLIVLSFSLVLLLAIRGYFRFRVMR